MGAMEPSLLVPLLTVGRSSSASLASGDGRAQVLMALVEEWEVGRQDQL